MGRKFFVGGNWQCNGTTEEVKKIVTTLNEPEVPSEDVVDDPKNSHLKKLEEGDERLTLLRAHFIGCKKLCSAKCKRSGRNGSAGVSHIASLADNQLGHESPYNAIVKVIRTGTPNPDFSRPWQKEEDNYTSESLGFIVRGRRVLTCAHSVDRLKKVELKKFNSDRLYPALVLSVAPDCDIAMLTVDGDEEFWEGVVPLEFGAIPAEDDRVIIIGYRIKSVLKKSKSGKVRRISGCVSSVDMVTYLHWGTKLLAFQVDVGTETGSSGGPIFNLESKCVGMTFQSTEFITDVIPPEVIEHFMQDYDKHGAYTGIPILAVKWQKMVNLGLRKSMKMKDDQQGVLITEVKPNYLEYESLKPGDVIISIDRTNIGNDGKVPFDGKLRIEFTYVVTKRYTGDNIDLKVIRNSEIKELNIKLATHKQFIQENISGRPLPYYIMAGIVFTTLSFPYLKDLRRRRRNNQHNREELESQSLYEEGKCRREELLSQALYEECVVVCEVLEDAINVGYHDEPGIVHSQVLTFNGMPVQNLQSLARMVENCAGEFLKIILENQKHLDVERKKARASIGRILTNHKVPSAMSDDLKEKLGLAKLGGQDDGDSDLQGEREWEQKLVMETNSARASTRDILNACGILAGISDNLKEKLIVAEQDDQLDSNWDWEWEHNRELVMDTYGILYGNLKEKLIVAEQDGQHDGDSNWEREQEREHNRELVMDMYGILYGNLKEKLIVAEQDGQHDEDLDGEREQEREHNRKLVVETNSARASTPDILDTCDRPPGIFDDLKEKLIVERDGQHDWKLDWEWEHEQEQEKIYKDEGAYNPTVAEGNHIGNSAATSRHYPILEGNY